MHQGPNAALQSHYSITGAAAYPRIHKGTLCTAQPLQELTFIDHHLATMLEDILEFCPGQGSRHGIALLFVVSLHEGLVASLLACSPNVAWRRKFYTDRYSDIDPFTCVCVCRYARLIPSGWWSWHLDSLRLRTPTSCPGGREQNGWSHCMTDTTTHMPGDYQGDAAERMLCCRHCSSSSRYCSGAFLGIKVVQFSNPHNWMECV